MIAFAIAGRIGTRDVGREWDVADAIENAEEVFVPISGGIEADVALAEFGAGDDFGVQFVVLAEKKMFADADFTAGTNQAFPFVWLSGELAG